MQYLSKRAQKAQASQIYKLDKHILQMIQRTRSLQHEVRTWHAEIVHYDKDSITKVVKNMYTIDYFIRDNTNISPYVVFHELTNAMTGSDYELIRTINERYRHAILMVLKDK